MAAEAQRSMKTPLCADESAESIEALQQIIRLGAARIINIKIQRVGGLTSARRMHDFALMNGVRCWVGTMPELGIGQAQAAALSSLPGCTFPTDVEASARWFRDDIIDPWIEVRSGMIAMPTAPGLGRRIDTNKLARYKVRERTFAR
jgi:O-succinylbenzoate synthase